MGLRKPEGEELRRVPLPYPLLLMIDERPEPYKNGAYPAEIYLGWVTPVPHKDSEYTIHDYVLYGEDRRPNEFDKQKLPVYVWKVGSKFSLDTLGMGLVTYVIDADFVTIDHPEIPMYLDLHKALEPWENIMLIEYDDTKEKHDELVVLIDEHLAFRK